MKYSKHIHVLQLLSTIPPNPVRAYVNKHNQPYPAEWLQQCNDAWDHLFTYIHANWARPDTAMADGDIVCSYPTITSVQGKVDVFDCRVMLAMGRDDLEAKLASLPPYFSETIFPVAVARYMLGGIHLNLPIQHRELTTFHEFHNRYGRIILS